MRKTIIVIPVLNPNDAFLPYVRKLIDEQYASIIIVNDGSAAEKAPLFETLKKLPEVTVLTHSVNMGKGRALKSGFNYILTDPNASDYSGVITVDGDGQHTIEDVLKLSCKMEEEAANALVLGVRSFNEDNVPWTSRLGNTITKHLFKLLYGKGLVDTQTGLRGIPISLLSTFVAIEGERYSYETNMLVVAVKEDITFQEVPIETVYIEDNVESHFNALKDSVDIYALLFKNFFKFMSVSFSSFLIDLAFFQFFLFLFSFLITRSQIIVATILARVVSSVFNFVLNRRWVFESDKNLKQTLISYYGLALVVALVSGISVYWLFQLTSIKELILKIVIDALLFIMSYRIQKSLVFKTREK
ncbi:bifunctional glycosyltransferase family 2/GtrA family protein [Alkalibacterium gilvum]|uniref:Dolichol-phosphate mannosyltransferase n=1 Tax=Alkalibacterium gilvum TaxID=1130080 RepID=A0A1H6RW83_9LACT|nr:bifunctional glycosyltransferase family 2/GtrA family protein [Alkalibacterium gilvum]SEI56040.1 dolichol-phosphate mannosyltransferase [Alkalibacterium gilvum]